MKNLRETYAKLRKTYKRRPPERALGATLKLCRWRTLNGEGQLRHRAVSLRQHGFLVLVWVRRKSIYFSVTKICGPHITT